MAKMKTYRIAARADDKYQLAVTAGERTFHIDQPLLAGGGDAGASPMEHLFAALAGCIATTARIIATQKKLSLNGMDISVEGALDLDIIYGKSSEGRPGLSGITVTLALDSAMSDTEQKSFLEEIHARCPLMDTVAAATPLAVALA